MRARRVRTKAGGRRFADDVKACERHEYESPAERCWKCKPKHGSAPELIRLSLQQMRALQGEPC